MKQYYGLLCIIFFVLALALAVAFVGMLLFWKKEKERLVLEAEEKYQLGKEEVADVMRMTIDKIPDEKGSLSELSEKDLMIETMVALSSYARRLDRIDEKIGSISNYKTYISAMNQEMETLSTNASNLQEELQDARQQVENYKEAVGEIIDLVTKVNAGLDDVASIEERVTGLTMNLKRTVETLVQMNQAVNSVSDKTNEFFKNYTDTPVEKMNQMKEDIAEVKGKISESLEGFSSAEVLSRLEAVEALMNTLQESIKNLETKGVNEDLLREIGVIKNKLESLEPTVAQ